MELEDLDEELEEKSEDIPENEGEAVSLKDLALWQKIVIFCCMFLIAAVITTILWNLTPKGDTTGGQASEESQTVQAPVSTQLPTPEPTVVPTPEPTAVPTEVPTIVPTTEPTQVPSAEPTAGNQTESGQEDMGFEEISDSVTPKDVINLRSNPSTTDESNIVTQAQNGQILSRIGINYNTGWSQIDYEGQILYAVSQYLSEDLNYKTPVVVSDPNRVSTIDGRVIVFVDCDDWISPKEYVNLRIEPSTTEGNATVSCQLNYGEKVHRTGYSADSGWSRVEYNGQVLYVVSSYMYVVTE